MVPCFGTGLIVFGGLGKGHTKLLVLLYHAVGATCRRYCLVDCFDGLFVLILLIDGSLLLDGTRTLG